MEMEVVEGAGEELHDFILLSEDPEPAMESPHSSISSRVEDYSNKVGQKSLTVSAFTSTGGITGARGIAEKESEGMHIWASCADFATDFEEALLLVVRRGREEAEGKNWQSSRTTPRAQHRIDPPTLNPVTAEAGDRGVSCQEEGDERTRSSPTPWCRAVPQQRSTKRQGRLSKSERWVSHMFHPYKDTEAERNIVRMKNASLGGRGPNASEEVSRYATFYWQGGRRRTNFQPLGVFDVTMTEFSLMLVFIFLYKSPTCLIGVWLDLLKQAIKASRVKDPKPIGSSKKCFQVRKKQKIGSPTRETTQREQLKLKSKRNQVVLRPLRMWTEVKAHENALVLVRSSLQDNQENSVKLKAENAILHTENTQLKAQLVQLITSCPSVRLKLARRTWPPSRPQICGVTLLRILLYCCTRMAASLGVFSSIFPANTAPLARLSPTAVRLVPTNLRPMRTVTIVAAASKAAVEKKKREPKGIMKPQRVSPEMQAFLGGTTEIPRTQALKEIWAYIKQHNLQDPADKKVIVCDEKLKKIFGGRERVGFLEIARLISPHFLK
ncbi:SWIB/MDM2 domain superfamily protein [Striga asiatica]|uniref:SWIB/MDM2 domain superfamily protein n=1 Tax=Striga asiatica TaxID=4170 RepID=A0A5A7P8K1_STRAF|nr:SWIB/MDM2 domain superfamily protein [Striga asiatica]